MPTLPAITVTDAELDDLAREIGQMGDITALIKQQQLGIRDKIAMRAWYRYCAEQDRAGRHVEGMDGPAIG